MSTHAADRVPLLRLGPTRALARRSSLLRCCLALSIAAFGCVQVLAVENGAAGTLVGAGLVALAAPLARGRRRALLATAALVLASLVLDEDAVAWPGLAAVVLLMALLVGAPAFRASGDPATRRLIVPAAALLAIGLVADLARACGQLAHPLGATLLVGAGMLAACALRPWRGGTDGGPAQLARAARTVAEHATDTLAPFTLRPDKQLFFGSEAPASSPIAWSPASRSSRAIRSATRRPSRRSSRPSPRFAERRGWVLGVLGAGTGRLAPVARHRAARALHGR